MVSEPKPKKPRKKPKPSALTRPPKRGKKKKKPNVVRPASPFPVPVPSLQPLQPILPPPPPSLPQPPLSISSATHLRKLLFKYLLY